MNQWPHLSSIAQDSLLKHAVLLSLHVSTCASFIETTDQCFTPSPTDRVFNEATNTIQGCQIFNICDWMNLHRDLYTVYCDKTLSLRISDPSFHQSPFAFFFMTFVVDKLKSYCMYFTLTRQCSIYKITSFGQFTKTVQFVGSCNSRANIEHN